ncbi:MAG: apolipoprotein N-acyltransferase [Verrucomicrobiota bacterium]
MGQRSAWIKIAAAVVSGLLVAGLFPPFGMGALVWLALVPLLAALWSIDGRRAGWRGFGLGWLAGTVTSLAQFNWLGIVSPLGLVVLPVYLGLFWGLFGAFAATLGNPWCHPPSAATSSAVVIRRSLRVALCHGAVWAGLEWLRGWLFTGFGWNGLGVALGGTPVLAQAADLLGVTGLALLPVFCQAVVVQAARRWLETPRAGRRPPLDVAVALAVIGLLAGYGGWRIRTEHRAESLRLKTLLVQINIPQDAAQVLWSALDIHLAYEQETLKALAGLTEHKPSPWPDWVMWPESALTGRILRAADGSWGTWRENQETIAQVRAAGPFQLLYGVNELEAEKTGDDQLTMKANGRAWNSLAVMSPDDVLQTYRKHHLVIFGETIPFVDTIPFLKKIYAQQAGIEYGGSFTPGVTVDPLPIPTAHGTVIGAIPTVCFEDSVPRLPRLFVRPGPQVIVNVTNDGWFKESAVTAQHFANARFRAIELRRPMLRCANNGISAAIDTTGSTAHPDTGQPQILMDAQGNHFIRGSLLAELNIPLRPSTTLYALIGDWGVITLALASLLWAWRTRPETLPFIQIDK